MYIFAPLVTTQERGTRAKMSQFATLQMFRELKLNTGYLWQSDAKK